MEPNPLKVNDWNLEAPDSDEPTRREIEENAAEVYDQQRRER
jgi:hypothetical protein